MNALTDFGPDVEGDVRAMLRDDPDVAALVGARVFLSTRALTEASYPCVVVTLAGSSDDTSEAPIDLALVQLDCWGPMTSKSVTTDVVNAVRSALHRHGIDVAGRVWAPDPDDRRPRYVVTAAVTALSS